MKDIINYSKSNMGYFQGMGDFSSGKRFLLVGVGIYPRELITTNSYYTRHFTCIMHHLSSMLYSPSDSCSGLSFLFFIIILLFRWLGEGRDLPSSSFIRQKQNTFISSVRSSQRLKQYLLVY